MRVTLLPALLTVACLGLVACSGDSDEGVHSEDPASVLAGAAETLSETSGTSLTLATDELPEGVNGITSAVGAVTDAPAFDGTLDIRLGGIDFDVPVIAVDGKVWAQIPLTSGWSDIDPGAYGAPDPSGLIGADAGLVALLEATDDPTKQDTVRGGEDNSEVLTTYTGTIAGDVMKRVIPSSADDTFDVVHHVTSDGQLRQTEMTGVFYKDSDEMTYTLTVTEYGLDRTITKP
ncbi:LppX_LprAFG lipoprotein [Nocardioides gilvus]|uniref:LppX_LprAFG lipoprotein n=1 Tax=Nocardioides gilvus TaxID=1735589 RepID=UPI000D745131|nr:LppX_LprAFG lipoprotein [Nocardioides gilvus]